MLNDDPHKCRFSRCTRIPQRKRHLDRFRRFGTARSRDQQTHRQTDHATCVTIGRILFCAQGTKACRELQYNTIEVFKNCNTLKMSDHFDNSFRGCLTKLLPYILFQKIYLYFGAGNGRPREPALCQLYRHSFVPYSDAA